jgi:site-specific DNA-methyltransferase (adenine-specific)
MDEQARTTLMSSKMHSWETPRKVFEWIEKELSVKFSLDVAATDKNKMCDFYINKEMDALLRPWHRHAFEPISWLYPLAPIDHVWCNPPYGRGIKDWLVNAEKNVSMGSCLSSTLLLPSRTDTSYFHGICRKGLVGLIPKRIKFLIDGVEGDAAPFPSMIVHFEPSNKRAGEIIRLESNW